MQNSPSIVIVAGMQKVVTHSGSFDPDDVLAVASLQLYLGVDNLEIVRSRDENIIKEADWVIDVGGVYDVAAQRFDHHQNGVPHRENNIPYSSFGLVWREFGSTICDGEEIAKQIEQRFVLPIDAADNHMTISLPNQPDVLPFEFFDVIDTFRPVWGSGEDFDVQFLQAVEFGRSLLERLISHAKGRVALLEMIDAHYEAAEDKTILIFEEPIARYALVDHKDVKVVVSPVFAADVNNWMAVVIPDKDRGFENRVVFPKAWGGLADNELASVSGIEEAVFCHKERYIFIAKTKEAALQAAQQATKVV